MSLDATSAESAPPGDGAETASVPEPSTLRGREIVCVGLADWNAEIPTSQHHLMSRLAHRNRILFVESLGLRRPQFAYQDATRMLRRAKAGFRGLRRAGEIHVLSPAVVPFHGAAIIRALNARILRRQVFNAASELRVGRPVLWAYSPFAEPLIRRLKPSLVVYHCVDDLAAHKGVHAESFRAAERRLVENADLVIASSPALATRMREITDRVLEAPNVADVEFFASAAGAGPVDADLAALPGPRVVFTGAVVATKLDFEFLISLARLRRDCTFALVGPIGAGDPSTDPSPLRREPNIHLLGPRPYPQLPQVLRAADAALIPYAINPLTTSVFPMKVYEYLAAGLPVVSTELPALDGVDGLTLVPDATAAAAALERLLTEDPEERRNRQMAAAVGHSWEERLAEISAAVERRESGAAV